MPADAKKPAHGGSLSLALDFGPLLVFFLSYKGAGWFWGAGNPITAMSFGTAAFMAAIVIAVIISKVKLGRVSPKERQHSANSTSA